MIRYIFAGKLKNSFVIIFSAIYLLIKLRISFVYVALRLVPVRIGVLELVGIIPPILILVYMITLKREYKFKNCLFPAAFLILAFTASFSIVDSIIRAAGILIGNPLSAFAKSYLLNTCITSLPQLALIAGFILAFVGSINNFKRITFLRVGTILCAVFILFSALHDGLYLYSTPDDFFSLLHEITFYKGLLETGLISLLYVSIFLLTLGKKGEDMDIAPFVEARKAKKEAKRARKLQREAELETVPPEAPEGYWRCMGCGKLLPDSANECDCGYKK